MRSALLKVLLLPLCCFGFSDCHHHHHATALFSHNPSRVQASFSCGCNINKKVYFRRFRGCRAKRRILGSVAFLHSFADKRNETLLFLFPCAGVTRGFGQGVGGNNCAEMVCFMRVRVCVCMWERCCRRLLLQNAAGRICLWLCAAVSSSAVAEQLYNLLVPCPSVRMGPGTGRRTWHNTAQGDTSSWLPVFQFHKTQN